MYTLQYFSYDMCKLYVTTSMKTLVQPHFLSSQILEISFSFTATCKFTFGKQENSKLHSQIIKRVN